MLYAIARDEIFRDIQDLNCRQLFALSRIEGANVKALVAAIEQKEDASHLFVDLEGVRNLDNALDLVERITKTKSNTRLIVLGEMLDAGSVIYRDIQSMGVGDILLQAGASMKKALTGILIRDGVIKQLQAEEEPATAEEEAPRPDAQVVPPSQMARGASKAMMLPKRSAKLNAQRAVTVAVAGVGTGIGTTTQVMQMALYLKGQDQTVAVLEVGSQNSLMEYLDILEGSVRVDDEHVVIDGVDIFVSGNSIARAKSKFHFLICDYGDYLAIPDVTAFLDKDIKVIVGGVKPWESRSMGTVFDADDGSINYIFSFVPAYDQEDVTELMEECAGRTQFAPYTPDYWEYSGADEVYGAILGYHDVDKAKTKPLEKGLIGLFRKKA